MLKKIIAFSLAEVLMVAGIAAVVGAMTIPNMKKSYEKKARIAKAKTTFATLDGAISQIDYTKVLRGKTTQAQKAETMMNNLQNLVQFRYVCGLQSASTACFSHSKITDSTNDKQSMNASTFLTRANQSKFCSNAILKNGSEILLCMIYATPYNDGTILNDYHGAILVDVDGAKRGPNTRGQDVFAFNIGSTGLSYFPNSIEANLLDH